MEETKTYGAFSVIGRAIGIVTDATVSAVKHTGNFLVDATNGLIDGFNSAGESTDKPAPVKKTTHIEID
jgi:hypothetical protein